MTGNVVESRRLWPALRFDSFADLILHAGSIQSNSSETAGKLKGKLTVQYSRLRRAAEGRRSDASGHAVGYLLYRGVGSGAIVIVPENDAGGVGDGEQATYDFFAHCCDMDTPGEDCPHVASERFQDAFREVSRRMEESLEDGGSEGAPSPARAVGGAAKTPAREANMTTVTSGRKAFEAAAVGSGAFAGADGDRKPAAKEESRPAAKKEAARKAPATATKKKPAKAERESPSGSPVAPVRSVVFSEVEENTVPSPLSDKTQTFSGPVDPAEVEGDGKSSPQKSEPAEAEKDCESSPQSDTLVLSWSDMHARMKSQGWTHTSGVGHLSDWIYIHPSCKGMKKQELLQTKERGVHWFADYDELMRYAKKNLGWIDAEGGYASSGTPKSESSAENAAERIKKRATRRASRAKTSSLVVGDIAADDRAGRAASRSRNARKDEKKEPPKKTGGNRAKRQAGYAASAKGRVSISPPTEKVAAKKEARKKPAAKREARKKPAARPAQQPPSTPAPAASSSAASVDDESRFSTESPASRTRGSQRASLESFAAASSQRSPSEASASTVDECYQVLPSHEGWCRLISHYGFSYHGGKYCYPGNENKPGKGSVAEEGVHYFDTIEGIRRHICAYGLPKEVMYLDHQMRDELNRWIRYANVKNLDDGAMINPEQVPVIPFKEAWSLLQRCGLRWSGSRGYCYERPRTNEWLHLPEDFKFDTYEEMIEHLARFGVPNEVEVDGRERMDRLARLSLDLHIVVDSRQVDTL